MKEEMLKSKFGIEIEFTGITRKEATEVVRRTIGGTIIQAPVDWYDKRIVQQPDGRKWTIMSDGSIMCMRKNAAGNIIRASRDYSVELVSPILTYREDIEQLQQIIRNLREAGGFTGKSSQCGIHIHLDGEPHTVKSLKNFINIIASKNDLLYKALQIKPERMHWCQKMDEKLVNKLKTRRPKTEEQIRKKYTLHSSYEQT